MAEGNETVTTAMRKLRAADGSSPALDLIRYVLEWTAAYAALVKGGKEDEAAVMRAELDRAETAVKGGFPWVGLLRAGVRKAHDDVRQSGKEDPNHA